MKKAKYLLVLVAALFLTGCVKMDATMKINKDKSMDYEIIIAMAKDLVTDDTKILSDDQVKQAKKNGYKLSEYSDDEMKGYKAVRHVKNIDSVSTTKKSESSLDMDSKAKLTSNSTSNLNNQMNSDTTTNDDEEYNYDDEDYDYDYEDDDYDYEDDDDSNDLDISGDTDYSKYTENMEFKFEVQLPYKAKKNNATSVDKSGKKLTWNLLQTTDNIEFEFELSNMTNIYITIGAAVAVIAGIVVFILKKRKKA